MAILASDGTAGPLTLMATAPGLARPASPCRCSPTSSRAKTHGLDRVINAAEVAFVKSRSGSSLPAPAPANVNP